MGSSPLSPALHYSSARDTFLKTIFSDFAFVFHCFVVLILFILPVKHDEHQLINVLLVYEMYSGSTLNSVLHFFFCTIV